MIRSLSVIALGAALAWPVAAHAQRGGGGGGTRGGQGAVRQGGVTFTSPLVNTTNRAPQGGALGTPGGSGPWVGGAIAQAGAGTVRSNVRGRAGGGRFNDVAAVQNYPVYPQGYYGIPTFTTGFDTGYYPPGVWPSPVVTPPIYPEPYYQQQLDLGISPQEAAMAAELARISQQLEELRNQSLATGQPIPVPQPVSGAGQREKTAMPTVLLMRDGRQIETQSYAIADQTLWVFSEGGSQRFSLSDLDVEATQRENAKRGIRFIIER